MNTRDKLAKEFFEKRRIESAKRFTILHNTLKYRGMNAFKKKIIDFTKK